MQKTNQIRPPCISNAPKNNNFTNRYVKNVRKYASPLGFGTSKYIRKVKQAKMVFDFANDIRRSNHPQGGHTAFQARIIHRKDKIVYLFIVTSNRQNKNAAQ